MPNPKTKWTNWSKSFTSFPEKMIAVSSEKELIDIVLESHKNTSKIKLVGSGHSASKIAEIHEGTLISLEKYNKVLSFDKEELLVTVEAGISLYDLNVFLFKNGASLSNLGTINAQSISGAISTGTHGSGASIGSIDQQVVSLDIILASGNVMTVSTEENSEIFNATRVGLGALGIISKVTLKVEPQFNLEINASTLSFDGMLNYLPKIRETDHLSFWWVPHTNKVSLWKADRSQEKSTKTNALSDWYNGVFKGNIFHEFGLWITSFFPKKIPLLNKIMYHLLFQKDSHKIGPSHKLFALPIHVKQSVMEYGIPVEKAKEVLTEINDLLEEKNFKAHMPIEVRFAPKNDAWLSMAFGRETCYIGIISYKPYGKNIPHDTYFKAVHDIFIKYNGRPHWAKKQFYTIGDFPKTYPHWNDFKKLKQELDPKGIFENDFLKELFS